MSLAESKESLINLRNNKSFPSLEYYNETCATENI